MQAHQGFPLDEVAQDVFEVGLVEHVGLGKAVGTHKVVAQEPGQDAVSGVDELHTEAGPAVCGEGVGGSDGLEDAHDLVVHVNRAWQRVGRRVTFEDLARHSVPCEQESRDQADGSSSEHGDRCVSAVARQGRGRRRRV
ncbi:hypothetical protein N7U49_45670 [Streptomyces sp. AD2-2]|nr:hypothetical protein N7U49_45670 [Streptomyces sp. AD2-2]